MSGTLLGPSQQVVNQVVQVLGSAAVVASQVQRFGSPDLQAVGQRFPWVGGDAIRERASGDVHDFFAQVDGQFLGHTVRSDDGHVGFWGNEGEAVQFILVQFPVFNLDDVLGPHLLRGDVHDHGHRDGGGGLNPKHFQHLHALARWNVVNDRAVSDRRDPSHVVFLTHQASPP